MVKSSAKPLFVGMKLIHKTSCVSIISPVPLIIQEGKCEQFLKLKNNRPGKKQSTLPSMITPYKILDLF
jgi:hypothetical protein